MLFEEKGVGQPISMKSNNVQLPHPQPNGDASLEVGLELVLHLVELVVGLSESGVE